MFGLDMLDVLIGLVTVYLSFGIACTALVEAISSMAGLRSRNLRDGIDELFQGKLPHKRKAKGEDFAEAFYAHPLIQTLSRKEAGRPSYIPTEIVGQVVVSLLKRGNKEAGLEEMLNKLPGDKPGDNRIKDLLLEFNAQVNGEVEAFRQKIETHFDTTMERVTGWFKRKAQFLAISVSLVLVVFANVDSVDIVRSLASNPEARASLIQSAERLLAEQPVPDKSEGPENPGLDAAVNQTEEAWDTYRLTMSSIEQTGLKLGWERCPEGAAEWLSKIIGLLVSALAVSLGAPFWFETLQRINAVRGAGSTAKKDSNP